jgi:cephalosporin hydroxylase
MKEIIQRAHEFGMIQNQVEVEMFLEWYYQRMFRNIMEIGTHTGGFLSLLIEVGVPKNLIISLDLPWQAHEYKVGDFREKYKHRVRFLVGNSHDLMSQIKVDEELLRCGTQIDFLFLDGDHSYEGVRQDFEMYSGFVRPGGWIGFHDINNGHQCGDFYWKHAIRDRAHVEFGFGRTFGLGCVRMEVT